MIAKFKSQLTTLTPVQIAAVMVVFMFSLIAALGLVWALRRYNAHRSSRP